MVTELGAGVWWLDLRGVNAYLVDDAGTLTLVDAGAPWTVRGLGRGVRAAGHRVADVDRVLVTHYDVDHVGGLARLPDLEATVHVGAADAPLVTGERRPDWHTHKGAFQWVTGWLAGRPSLPVEPVEDGEEVGSFTAYHTPGHTRGHTAFVSEVRTAGFLGDLVRETGGELAPSPWVMSLDTESVKRSIRSLAERAPPFEVLGMGHGTPFARGGSEQLAALAGAV